MNLLLSYRSPSQLPRNVPQLHPQSAFRIPQSEISSHPSSFIPRPPALEAATVGAEIPIPNREAFIQFRPYQRAAFENRTNGIEVWLWGRQTGKSFTLAAWAVDRLITMPGRTVTILSNSRLNGMELNRKCAEVCQVLGRAFEQVDLSTDGRFENLRAETRITINGRVGRILVLAANPLTARGFSGDVIFDEFAFQENGTAIWEAAQPILDANKDYLCRIASTPNGKHNQFYRMATDPAIPLRRVTRTEAHAQGCPVFHPITREAITPEQARELAPNKRAYDQNFECAFEDESMALLTHELISAAERPHLGFICETNWSEAALASLLGSAPVPGAPFGVPPNVPFSNAKCPMLDDQCSIPFSPSPVGRGWGEGFPPSAPRTARQWLAASPDPDATYRQILMTCCNGSCDRIDALLHSDDEILLTEVYQPGRTRRERDSGRHLFVGVDVGRHHDRTVITVLERAGNVHQLRALLRLQDMRLPQQQERLEQLLRLPPVRAAQIDMTGLGLGLYEYTREKFPNKITGVHFASSVPVSSSSSPRWGEGKGEVLSIRITEHLATQLLQTFEDRALQIPIDHTLRDDLRKPERFVSPSGRVSIAATRNEAGHADHFWSLALALNAARTPVQPPLEYMAWTPKAYQRHCTI